VKKVSLVILTPGTHEDRVLSIALSEFLIGRDSRCHLRPASSTVSELHCALIQRGGEVFLRDLNSATGTFVNDQRIEGAVRLRSYDRVRIGRLQLAVRIESMPSTPVPATRAAAVSRRG
jgi:pSer/pThr/pTyr-binding forkhead associated (FHA) protein